MHEVRTGSEAVKPWKMPGITDSPGTRLVG